MIAKEIWLFYPSCQRLPLQSLISVEQAGGYVLYKAGSRKGGNRSSSARVQAERAIGLCFFTACLNRLLYPLFICTTPPTKPKEQYLKYQILFSLIVSRPRFSYCLPYAFGTRSYNDLITIVLPANKIRDYEYNQLKVDIWTARPLPAHSAYA